MRLFATLGAFVLAASALVSAQAPASQEGGLATHARIPKPS